MPFHSPLDPVISDGIFRPPVPGWNDRPWRALFMRELPGFGKRNGSRMRVLKLDDLAPIVVGVIWRGRLPALADELAGEFRNRARQLLT